MKPDSWSTVVSVIAFIALPFAVWILYSIYSRGRRIASASQEPQAAANDQELSMSTNSCICTIVMRGPSAAIFSEGTQFSITVHSPDGNIHVGYTSRWIKKSETVVLPGHLWIDITGPATNLEMALETFPNAGLMALPILAVSANAAVSHPDIELGYDCTLGLRERDFFQAFVPGEGQIVRPGRVIDVPSTSALAAAVASCPYHDRLVRAMAQYQLALENWSMESSILAVAHLWMAVEALTKARIRLEIAKRKLADESALAAAMGIEKKALDSTIRRQVIFQGDNQCYEDTLDASDGFEHGFLDMGKMRTLTAGVRVRAAQHIRTEILEISGIDGAARAKLLAEPYHEPLGTRALVKYMRGKLVGSSENLAKQGNAYPILRWTSNIEAGQLDAAGKMQYQFNESYQVEFGEGIAFKPVRYEVWKPS